MAKSDCGYKTYTSSFQNHHRIRTGKIKHITTHVGVNVGKVPSAAL